MKHLLHIFSCIFLFPVWLASQPQPFKERTGWGIMEDGRILVAAIYDTVFNFDATGKVCMACYKTKMASPNKFIKTFTKAYSCNYFNRKYKRLVVRSEHNDTCSVFLLGKNTVKLYNDNPNYFTVSIKSKKNLVSKDFKQLTFKGYTEIMLSPDPNYYIVQNTDEFGTTLANLIDQNEEQLIPFNYSSIKLNPYDSLIIGCSAGIRPNGNDDIFNYMGKKIESYHRHVDMATKNFVIHKLFEPKEYYIIYNINTKEETTLNADEIQPQAHDEILMRVKNDWYLYDLNTNQKKPYKPS